MSGAFDRVSAKRLVEKLSAAGVPDKWLQVFRSWLRERPATVAVGGEHSNTITLFDMVFQGTVWGPQLWNAFYADAKKAIRAMGFEETVFADDLNAFKAFLVRTPNENLLKEAQVCQIELHKWGKANQVSFDPGKESMHVVSHQEPEGEDFKNLGVKFDCGLTMETGVRETVHEVSWKLRTLARSMRYHNDAQLVLWYKSRVLSFLEYRTSAFYHATDTTLKPLDNLQDNFLKKLVIPELTALMEFRLAPLTTRRDIAMLGLVHRAALKEGPPQFWEFFTREGYVTETTSQD